MRAEPWWRRNQRLGLFRHIADVDDSAEEALASAPALELDFGDFESLDAAPAPAAPAPKPVLAAAATEAEIELAAEAEPVQLTAPKLRLQRISSAAAGGEKSESESDSEEGSEDYESDEDEQFAEFKQFPVQVTLLEKADGTMDELLEAEEDDAALADTKEARWSAWLFQVIAALAAAQHWFGFVHNDLHTNNVMWSKTEATHIYYRIHGVS